MNPVLSLLFVLAVIIAPLPFGGNIPTAWTTSAFIAGVFVIALSVKSKIFGLISTFKGQKSRNFLLQV